MECNIVYNLGDFIRSKRYRTLGWYNTKNFDVIFCNKYPDTICADFNKRNLDDKQSTKPYYDDANINYKLLYDIVKERTPNNIIPDNDTVCIHLRIGDVIDYADDNKFNCDVFLHSEVTYRNGNKYVKPLTYFEEKLISLKKFDIQNIILNAFEYDKDMNTNSYTYTITIRDFFIDKGFKVIVTYDTNADSDFLKMCNYKYFIPSGGGYSKLIATMVTMNNNIVL
jgi:hypothetical protein